MAIVEKQTIRFTPDRRLQGRSVNLGNEGDNMVRRIMFALPDVDEHQAATLMYGGKYADMIRLTAMDGKWVADLTSEMVGAAGEVEGYIRIDGPDGEVWRSDPFRIETGDVPEIEVQIEKLYPTAIGQMLTAMAEHSVEMEEQVKRAEDAADRAEAAGGGGGGTGGADGEDGGYYRPSVSADGDLSWSASKPGMPGVETVNIRGQVGPEGRPGRDGTDAEVTAGNIAAALGYTPADAEKVSKLSEEKADKSEIPEPYTLPVATADTLGGVMIGDGFVVDEYGRVSVKIGGDSGLNGKIELIEEINLTEDTSSIVRNLLPDGTPYNFKFVLAMIGFYQDISNKWIRFIARYTDYLYSANPYVAGKITEYAQHKAINVSGNKYQALHTGVVELDGVIMGVATTPHLNPGYHNSSSMTISSKVAYNVQNASIREVAIESEIPLVAGTSILLFGVKRDD